MIIKRIEGATRVFGAPPDWDGVDCACGALPVRDVQDANGNWLVSAWEPTPAELAALNAGGSIHLGIRGTQHPVVFLGVKAVGHD